MSDDTRPEESGYEVRDRRRVVSDDAESMSTPVSDDEPATDSSGSATSAESPAASEPAPSKTGKPLPPMDFVTFAMSLATTALIQLGIAGAPDGSKVDQDLPGAKQTIDILEMLQQKTAGNLTEQEAKVLQDMLFQVRMAYVQATQRS